MERLLLFIQIVYFSMTLVNSAHCYAPLGDISIGIKCAPGVVGPAEADIDFDIIKNDNDTFTVKYTPPGPGRYTIMVLFAEQVEIQFSAQEGLFGRMIFGFLFSLEWSLKIIFNIGVDRKFPSVHSKSKWIHPMMLARWERRDPDSTRQVRSTDTNSKN